MQALKQRQATELYRLAYLLTGDSETSLDVALDAIEESETSFFSQWMAAWSRRVVIAKALVAIRAELTASAARTPQGCARNRPLPPAGWTLPSDASAAELDRALLAIDAFPRCALLLTVFERVALHDAAILLDSTEARVENARNFALCDLAVNLAPSPTSDAGRFSVITGEMQHA